METRKQAHPSPLHLAALALGKLAPEATERVAEHVKACPTCSKFLSDTPRDSLADLLRDSSAGKTNLADQSTPGVRDETTLGGKPAPPARKTKGPRRREKPQLDATDIPKSLREQTKYRIVRLLGRGGMGSVYEAHHEAMDRRVAIKIINPSLVEHSEALARFGQEVKAAARLDHTNVARAYDADKFGDSRVLVMEYVPGRSLDAFLQDRGQLTVVEACRLVRQAMVGLNHAHDRGMVHRDLKPQNLMLTPDGKVKILDFGLAKVASEQKRVAGLTRENALMGTPHYLAPEQALDAAQADIRADIYSLGCTLYCLLAGHPPFDGDTEMKVLMAHQHEAPRALREIRNDVPQELSDLVDRMLAKDPNQRPQTPKEVYDALLPYAKGDITPGATRTDNPQTSRSAVDSGVSKTVPSGAGLSRGSLSNARLWGGGVVGLAIAFVLVAWLAGLFSIRTPEGTIVLENVPSEASVFVDGNFVTVTRDGESLTVAAVAMGEHHLKLVQGGEEIWSSDVAVTFGGEKVRVRYAPSEPPAGGSGQATPAETERVEVTLVRHFEKNSGVYGVDFSPDGMFVLAGGSSYDRNLVTWERDTGRRIQQLDVDGIRVAYSPDGQWVAAAGRQGNVFLRSLTADGEGKDLVQGSFVAAVDFSPDGRRIVSSGGDQSVRVWDIDNGNQICELTGHEHLVSCVAFSADGQRVVSGSADRTVRLWNVAGKSQMRKFDHADAVWDLAVSPDGRQVLTGTGGALIGPPGQMETEQGTDNRLRLWDLQTGELLQEMSGHTDVILGVAFTPDGKRAVSGSMDCSLRVWDLETGAELGRFDSATWVTAVDVSPDGEFIVAGGGSLKRDGQWVSDEVDVRGEERVRLFRMHGATTPGDTARDGTRGTSDDENNNATVDTTEIHQPSVTNLKFPLTVTMRVVDEFHDTLSYYDPTQLQLSESPGERLIAEPKYNSERPLYGTLHLGNGKDDAFTIVIDEPSLSESRIFIDLNNDEDLTNDNDGKWSKEVGLSRHLQQIAFDAEYERNGSNHVIPYWMQFHKRKTNNSWLVYYRDSARMGSLRTPSQTYRFVVVDDDSDGRFDDLESGQLFIDTDPYGSQAWGTTLRHKDALVLPFVLDETTCYVRSMSADGLSLVIDRTGTDGDNEKNQNARPETSYTIPLRAEEPITGVFSPEVPCEMSEQPIERLRAEPEYTSKQPLYGTLYLGSGEDRAITVVADKTDEGESRLILDQNNDEDLTNDPVHLGRTNRQVNLTLDYGPDAAGNNVRHAIRTLPSQRSNKVMFYASDSTRRGVLHLPEGPYQMAVLDNDSDGRFDDIDTGRLFVDVNQDGRFNTLRDDETPESLALDTPFTLGGYSWRVTSMSPDGLSLTVNRVDE